MITPALATEPAPPKPTRCESCNSIVDPMYPNCRCFD